MPAPELQYPIHAHQMQSFFDNIRDNNGTSQKQPGYLTGDGLL